MWVWVIAALIVLWLAVAYPGFRWFLGIVVAALCIGAWVLYDTGRKQEKEALSKVPPSQIVLEEVQLVPSFGSTSKMTGTIRNLSPHDVSHVGARSEAFDCPNETVPQDQCISIGLDEDVYLSGDVPGGAKRAIDAYVDFGNMPPAKGRVRYIYTVNRVRAKV